MVDLRFSEECNASIFRTVWYAKETPDICLLLTPYLIILNEMKEHYPFCKREQPLGRSRKPRWD
jgi:hypothetical protein